MSHPQFLQEGFDKQLAHLVEECGELLAATGELLAAAGKTQRWGPRSVNPLLPVTKRETNLDWLQREMNDVVEAIVRLQRTIKVDLL